MVNLKTSVSVLISIIIKDTANTNIINKLTFSKKYTKANLVRNVTTLGDRFTRVRLSHHSPGGSVRSL